jgi:hypothetical protein
LNNRNSTGDPLPTPTSSTILPPPSLLPPPPQSITPTKRRSKVRNTDRRNNDIEFATEIGQGLLLEVRKMQSLLQEKEEQLRAFDREKAESERLAELLAKQLKQSQENEGNILYMPAILLK